MTSIESNKKLGRPPRLSREKILSAAMQLVRSGEMHQLSMRRIAKELGTVPGSLYTYFADKEALLDALGAQVFVDMRFEVDSDLSWDRQIEQWMDSVHEKLLANQDLIFLMGVAGTSNESLAVIEAVACAIEQAGLSRVESILQAQSLLWTVLSFSLFEVQASAAKIIEQLQLSAQHAKHPETFANMAISDLQPLWETNLRRNIDGIKQRIATL
jgi:AcrR family transcriptional regulator